jgi:hypothetical protein
MNIAAGKFLPGLKLGRDDTGYYHSAYVFQFQILHGKERMEAARQFIGCFFPIRFQTPVTMQITVAEYTADSLGVSDIDC